MKSADLSFLFKSFLVWRGMLFLVALVAIYYLPLREDFLGGKIDTYKTLPVLWGWANFDGEHFLSIAIFGYRPLQYFFFPLFPVMVGFIGKHILNADIFYILVQGLILNNIFFLVAIIGLWKLVLIEYKKQVAKDTLYLLLLFPTAFYFVSFYSESLFLVLAIWFFYFCRKEEFGKAAILAGLASATTVVGIVLLPVFLIEIYLQRKQTRFYFINYFWGAICLTGLAGYMWFLQRTTGDPLIFKNTIGLFGEQRSVEMVLLPQVFYRYFFKIIPNINYKYLPVV